MVGAVRGVDPTTGFNYDDTRRYVEANTRLGAAERKMVFEENVRKVFPRLRK
jgi:4-oxalmesaconate hydratase